MYAYPQMAIIIIIFCIHITVCLICVLLFKLFVS